MGGKTHTAEAKAKMSALRKGFKHTAETLAKFRASKTAIAVSVTDLVTGVTTVYNSCAQAAQAIGCRNKAVQVRVHNKDMKPYKDRFDIKPVD